VRCALAAARPSVLPGAAVLFAACWSFVDSHILWPGGVFTMLGFAVAFALLAMAASHPAEDARKQGRLTNP
jgi:hypothetical protein